MGTCLSCLCCVYTPSSRTCGLSGLPTRKVPAWPFVEVVPASWLFFLSGQDISYNTQPRKRPKDPCRSLVDSWALRRLLYLGPMYAPEWYLDPWEERLLGSQIGSYEPPPASQGPKGHLRAFKSYQGLSKPCTSIKGRMVSIRWSWGFLKGPNRGGLGRTLKVCFFEGPLLGSYESLVV